MYFFFKNYYLRYMKAYPKVQKSFLTTYIVFANLLKATHVLQYEFVWINLLSTQLSREKNQK